MIITIEYLKERGKNWVGKGRGSSCYPNSLPPPSSNITCSQFIPLLEFFLFGAKKKWGGVMVRIFSARRKLQRTKYYR